MYTDKKDLVAFLGIDPLADVKNKWLSGLKFEMGWWYCAVDARQNGANAVHNSCNVRGYGKTRMAPTRKRPFTTRARLWARAARTTSILGFSTPSGHTGYEPSRVT